MFPPKAGVSLGSIALTPGRVPAFRIPSAAFGSPPRPGRAPTGDSPERARLLSHGSQDSSSDASPDGRPRPGRAPQTPQQQQQQQPASRRLLLRPPAPRPASKLHRKRRGEAADVDPSTRAAMSLPHVERVTTPYGFRAVLAASPCTRRRESLFHRNKAAVGAVLVTVDEPRYVARTSLSPEPAPPEPVSPAAARKSPGGPKRSLRPVKALGAQVLRELNRPIAALRLLTPGRRRAEQP